MENTTAALGDLKLLAVANGREHPDAACIVDTELLPALPPDHPQYTRREEARSRTTATNNANARRRYTIQMDAWTALYAKLKASTARSAPLLSRRLQETCDLAKTHGIADGYFDGPRAWRIIKQELQGGHKSEVNRAFYRKAEWLQRQTHLPDGAAADEYGKKALAFLIHIRPNLPQSYDDDDTPSPTTSTPERVLVR